MIELTSPVTSLQMIGPTYAAKLKRLNIETFGDLLYHFPFRYENYTPVSKINLIKPCEQIAVVGTLTTLKNIYTKYGKKIQKGLLSDETGEIEIVWYNQPYLIQVFEPSIKLMIAGVTKWFGHKLIFESPEFEIIKSDKRLIHTGRFVPIYPETQGVSSKWIRSRIDTILQKFSPNIVEFLPDPILKRFELIGENEAIYKIHFPVSYIDIEKAKRRLSFDELILLELAALQRKKAWGEYRVTNKFEIIRFNKQLQQFIDGLPFTLTNAQRKTVSEILTDLAKITPMNRLLEGDVGSGKTVVATIIMYLSYLNGYTCLLMAPTEILTEQHYQTINKLLTSHGVRVGLLTANKRVNDTKSFQVLVGTHALLSEKLNFEKLGLVIIDEQQRFGVEQRAILRGKGENPHVLTMTATPIPRTLALTLYSDLNISIIDEMPYGRLTVKTWVVPKEKRQSAYKWIKKQIINSKPLQQAFIICPFIDESETLTSIKAAKKEYQRLKTEIFPDLRLGLLHGQLKPADKENVLNEFKNEKLDILVSTPMVEVGIDIKMATIMVIEGADRFGLAQLHQLRGRVGRGNIQSYCLLFTDEGSEKSLLRLKLLEKIYNGPKLAEYDLKLRGTGEIFGTRQHGSLSLKIATLSDLSLINDTKKAANWLIYQDKDLSSFPLLRDKIQKYTIKQVAPD